MEGGGAGEFVNKSLVVEHTSPHTRAPPHARTTTPVPSLVAKGPPDVASAGGVGVACPSSEPEILYCFVVHPLQFGQEVPDCFVVHPLVPPGVPVTSFPPVCTVGGRAVGDVSRHYVFGGGPAGPPPLRLGGPPGDGHVVAQTPPRPALSPLGACERLQAGQPSRRVAGPQLPVYGAGLCAVGSVGVRSTPPLPWRAACVDFAARGPVSVAGVLFPHALFDLGAGPSCVHPDVLPEHVDLFPFEGGLFGAGGQPLPCLGEADLEVEACGRRCQHRFKVVPQLATPVLLGRDVIWGRLRLLPVPVEPGPTTTVTALVHTTPKPEFLGYVVSPPFPPEPESVLHTGPKVLGCVGSQPFPPEPKREIEGCVVCPPFPPLSLSLCLSLQGWVVWMLPALRERLFSSLPSSIQE